MQVGRALDHDRAEQSPAHTDSAPQASGPGAACGLSGPGETPTGPGDNRIINDWGGRSYQGRRSQPRGAGQKEGNGRRLRHGDAADGAPAGAALAGCAASALIWSAVTSRGARGFAAGCCAPGGFGGAWLWRPVGETAPVQVVSRRTVETQIRGLVTCMTGCSSGTGRCLVIERRPVFPCGARLLIVRSRIVPRAAFAGSFSHRPFWGVAAAVSRQRREG